MFARLFSKLLYHRSISLAILVAFTVGLGTFAIRVRPDYSVEHLFPVWDSTRAVYDRFKQRYPYEDARAIVIVEAKDLFTPDGIRRLAELEEGLRHIPGVIDVEGPLSTNDITAEEGWIAVRPLFTPELPAPEISARRDRAVTDPMFRWNLVDPEGKATSVKVTLTGETASSDDGRRAFLDRLEALVREHERPQVRITTSGIPIIRAKFIRLIEGDTMLLPPAALALVLVLLFVAFRSLGAVVGGVLTIAASMCWCYGVMGILGYPITSLASILPIVIIIISVSDTVHVVSDFIEHRRSAASSRQALIEAMANTAGPCLLTEVVLACGFLSLIAVNIVAVYQFGVVAAVAMMTTWLANMTVLPLVLSLTRSWEHAPAAEAARRAPRSVELLQGALARLSRLVTTHTDRVGIIALTFLLAGGLAGSRVREFSLAFDDVRPDSALGRDLRHAEATHGGLVPVAIYMEIKPGLASDPALDPELIAVADRAATMLERFPEIPNAVSLADPLRKAHGILSGHPGELPSSKALVAQEMSTFDDGHMLRDLISFDRHSLAAFGHAKDAGSPRVAEMFHEIDAWIAAEQAKLDAKAGKGNVSLFATGTLQVFDDVNETLVRGMLASLGLALLVTIVVFSVVLRSWRLGVIGVIPNVAPLVFVLGLMGLTGVSLKPSTVILFSITLVIADDDTIQYLTRYRRHYRSVARRLGSRDRAAIHRQATIECVREVGLPMLVTSLAVSAGFMVCLLSNTEALSNLGVLIGTTLFAAVFADLFLLPVLLVRIKPDLSSGADARAPAEEANK